MKVCTDSCLFGALIDVDTPTKRILDVGTGTGLLSLMCAQKSNNDTAIDAIEINQNAYIQAKENVENSIWQNRIEVIFNDFFSFEFKKQYDLLICNPPFFHKQLKTNDIVNNIARHNDDFNFDDFFSKCFTITTPNANLYLLMPYYRKNDTIELAKKYAWYLPIIYTIYNKIDAKPIRVVLQFSKQHTDSLMEHNISIYNQDNSYSSEFSKLLQDYYL